MAQSPDKALSSTPTQLPDVARPTHYAVNIVPDAANLRFDGHVVIDIDILKATNVITLNAADMTIASGAWSADPRPLFPSTRPRKARR